MREKTIEHKLTIAAKNMGGIALKFVSPSFDGMPDRIVLLPDGHMGFVEVKSLAWPIGDTIVQTIRGVHSANGTNGNNANGCILY